MPKMVPAFMESEIPPVCSQTPLSRTDIFQWNSLHNFTHYLSRSILMCFRNSSVNTATRPLAERPRNRYSIPSIGNICSFSPQLPDRFWCLTSFQSSGYGRFFFEVKSSHLTLRLRLVPRLSICRTIPPLPYSLSWHVSYLSTKIILHSLF
jgi:hypothetical protein